MFFKQTSEALIQIYIQYDRKIANIKVILKDFIQKLSNLETKDAFHLSELTSKTIPVVMRIFAFNQNYPARSVKS